MRVILLQPQRVAERGFPSRLIGRYGNHPIALRLNDAAGLFDQLPQRFWSVPFTHVSTLRDCTHVRLADSRHTATALRSEPAVAAATGMYTLLQQATGNKKPPLGGFLFSESGG